MQKILDAYGRHRSKTVSVRATAEELARMWNCAFAAGKGKQPYIYWALDHPQIHGVGNARLLSRLEEKLEEVAAALNHLAEESGQDALLTQTIQVLQAARTGAETLQGGDDHAGIL